MPVGSNSINRRFIANGVDDAYNNWINATNTYTAGIDTTDNSFKITDGATPSLGTNFLKIAPTSGEITYPTQPIFWARNSGSIGSVTGDGTIYPVVYNTVVGQVGTGYNSGTGLYTAPIAGWYQFFSSVFFTPFAAGHTFGLLTLTLTGIINFASFEANPVATQAGTTNACYWHVSGIVQMSAGQTVSSNLQVSGGTKTVGVTANSQFQGRLIG